MSGCVLSVLLAFACISDLRTRRIPNSLVLITASTGILLAVVTKFWVAGLTHAVGGLAVGLAIWLPFYLLRMLGAGDVKLFAAAATFLGARAAVEGALFTALYGGVVALAFMIVNSGWSLAMFRIGYAATEPILLKQTSSRHGRRIPYALAIAAGVLTALWWPGHILT